MIVSGPWGDLVFFGVQVPSTVGNVSCSPGENKVVQASSFSGRGCSGEVGVV